MRNIHWHDLTKTQQYGLIVLTIIQLALMVGALWDLRQRTDEEINGSKTLWTAAAFVNFIGPLAYFAFGRKLGPEA